MYVYVFIFAVLSVFYHVPCVSLAYISSEPIQGSALGAPPTPPQLSSGVRFPEVDAFPCPLTEKQQLTQGSAC